jgi:hypothetical protein
MAALSQGGLNIIVPVSVRRKVQGKDVAFKCKASAC